MKKLFDEAASISLVMGNIIGSGIFFIPIALAKFGYTSLIGFLIATFGALSIAAVLTHLNKYIRKTGGPYLYVKEALGEAMGFNVACSYFIAWCIGNATMILALPKFIAFFIPAFDESSLSFSSVYTVCFQLVITWLFIISNILGMRVVTWVQIFTTILKIIPLLLLIIFGLGKVDFHQITLQSHGDLFNFGAISSSITLAIWLFVGLESAIIPSDETKDHKMITRATYIGTIITAIILGFSYLILFALLDPDKVKDMAFPFGNAGEMILGHIGIGLMSLCAFVATVGAINGSILIQVKDSYGAAKDKIMPKFFGITNKYDAPVYGLILTGIIISVILVLNMHKTFVDAFNFVVLLSTIAFVIPYFLSAVSDIVLTQRRKERGKWMYYKIAVLAAIFSFWAIAGAGKDAVFYGLLFFMSFFGIYAVYKAFWR
jgi:APA family basic amino acid/polyamine antiporter